MAFLLSACAEIAGPVTPGSQPCGVSADCDQGFACHRGACFPEVVACDYDGIVEAGEDCDDGNKSYLDGCTQDCQLARCGDGIWRQDKGPGEAGYEACDDGNGVNADGCTNNCRLPECGDGYLAEGHGEVCEDGNLDDDDACLNNCQLARCGDGVVRRDLDEGDVGYEYCDDGNPVDGDACLTNCRLPNCGDGILRTDLSVEHPDYEDCDDGNDVETDACLSGCRSARCGDGLVQSGVEACDDGNRLATDGCLNDCQLARCGDGQFNPDIEPCDDGNEIEHDGCLTGCILARCGDGVVRRDVTDRGSPDFEDCEPGHYEGSYVCGADCRLRLRPRRLAAGQTHYCALRGGAIWCWGYRFDEAFFQDGRGRDPGPVESEPLGTRTLITSAQGESVCRIGPAGWGSCHQPYGWEIWNYPIPATQAVLDLALDRNGWLCFVLKDGRVECRSQDQPQGRIIANLTGAIDVEAGGCALNSEGQLSCWHDDGVAQAQAVEHRFHQIAYGKSCTQDAGAANGWCLLDRDGVVWSLVDGVAQEQTMFPNGIRQIVGGPDDARDVEMITCAINDEGGVLCARRAEAQASTVAGLPVIEEIAASLDSACAWAEDGAIFCWGQNHYQRVEAVENWVYLRTPVNYVDHVVRVEGLPQP